MNGGLLIWILALACATYVIYDVIVNNKSLSLGMKLLWIVFALFFSIITAAVYYFIGRNSKNDLFKGK